MPRPKDQKYVAKPNPKQEAPTVEASFQARLTSALLQFGSTANNTQPPKHENTNAGQIYAQAFMWDFIESYAKKQSDSFWKMMEEEGIIAEYKELEQGKHEIGESAAFVVEVSVSAPVKRFDQETLAEKMATSKYKVPTSVTLGFIEESKIGKNSSRTLRIHERSKPV